MNPKRQFIISLTCFFLAFLVIMSTYRTKDQELVARIAPNILRFHVLANSDSKKDQELKLKVRTVVLNSIYEQLDENASLEETKNYISTNATQIEQVATEYMHTQGYDYGAKLELTTSYFPQKVYGDMVFPAGEYEAARLIIGEGVGQNWWCVLYPPLCFTESTYAIMPDYSKNILLESIGPEDFQALIKEDEEDDTYQVNVTFKFLELLQDKTLPNK